MFKNKRGLIIIVILLIIVYVAISIIYVFPKGKKYSNTVFLGSLTKIEVKKGIFKVYNEDYKIKKQNVKLYFKGKFEECYIISKEVPSTGVGNNYFTYNKKGELLLPEMLIAHTPDISIKVKESDTKEIDDMNVVYKLAELKDVTVSDETELDYYKIDTIDIDGDKTNEEIYSVGLINYEVEYSDEEVTEEKEDVVINKSYISFVYMKKNDKYILIDKVESEGDPVSFIKLSFAKLIDFDNDDNYEFVIEKMMSEYGPYYYELYNYGSNKFTKIGGE